MLNGVRSLVLVVLLTRGPLGWCWLLAFTQRVLPPQPNAPGTGEGGCGARRVVWID